MSDNQDYRAGYRGGQFHHGMDRIAYDEGKAQKDLENTLSGAGGQKTEVNGVAFTLILIAPLIWMVYPFLGVTILAIPLTVCAILTALKIHQFAVLLVGFVLMVFAFFPGMTLEAKASQFSVYRWIRGVLRIVLSFGATVIFGSGADLHDRYFTLSKAQPGAIVGGFFVAVMAYLTFQRLDLLYFPALKEIKKMQEKLARGERPTRPLLKRMFFGFCWFIPVVMVLNLFINIGARVFIEDNAGRADFYARFNDLILGVNAVIWYLLCLTGKLPGTGKYMFIQRHEEDLKQIQI